MPVGSLWKFFREEEFECRDGTPVPNALIANLDLLVRGVLDPVRERWDGPLIPVSGYRTPEYNVRVGGAKLSQHMTARAVDIRPVKIAAVPLLHSLILTMYQAGQLPMLGGLGSYPRWVHVDVHKAKDGHLRRWGGAREGSEQTG